jgi:hypothetical protein
MEEKTINGQENLNDLKKMFANYQNQQSQSNSSKRENILVKYFVPRNTKEIFRILPPKAGKRHIEEAFFHVVTTTVAGGKKKHSTILYCPAHNDPKVPKLDANGNKVLDTNGQPILIAAPCPLCAKHKDILSKQDPSIKGIKKDDMNAMQLKVLEKNNEIYKEAIKWSAKKFYIVRGIDKGSEKDGVKFWRFKHNYKNQGTLDKLLPILQDYLETQQADFSDPKNGTDLSIIMTDSEFNGRVYKTISAITARGKSPLHSDPIVVRQWLEDDISWRDVFLPKKAPNITPYQFLEMVADGNNPYWDDSDQSNKRWVFPGRLDLEEAANNRQRNLDADDNEQHEMASDLNPNTNEIIKEMNSGVNISNITENHVGNSNDDNAVNLAKETVNMETQPQQEQPISEPQDDSQDDSPDDYDDLPF